jgi:hypothetical protein
VGEAEQSPVSRLVEARLLGAAQDQLDVVPLVVFDALLGPGQHFRAGFDAHHRTAVADPFEDRAEAEPGAAADVGDDLAGPGIEQLDHPGAIGRRPICLRVVLLGMLRITQESQLPVGQPGSQHFVLDGHDRHPQCPARVCRAFTLALFRKFLPVHD